MSLLMELDVLCHKARGERRRGRPDLQKTCSRKTPSG